MAYGQGGRGGRGRHRWMQKATGLPGWMRFGFSPGWSDRSPNGLPPAAQWIMQSGLLPQFMSFLQTTQPGTESAVPFQLSSFSSDQEKQILTQQLEFLEQQIETIRKRIVELEQEE